MPRNRRPAMPLMFRFNANADMTSDARLHLRRVCTEAEGYLELAMPEHALDSLQRWGQHVHGDARGCYLLGETLRELQRYREAIFPLRRCLELIPDDIHVAMALGWCFKRMGQLEEAIDALEHAVEIDPSEAVLHYNLACYWSLAHNRRRALQCLAHALEIDGNFRDLVCDEPDFDPIRTDPLFRALTAVAT